MPPNQELLARARLVGHMQADIRRLPDAIQTSDALLEYIGIGRKIGEDQIRGMLEVAPLTTDLRADQHNGALRILEISRVAITRQERKLFMEGHRLESVILAHGLFERHRARGVRADHEGLDGAVLLAKFTQPMRKLAFETVRVKLTPRKKRVLELHHPAGIAEIHSARAVLVDERQHLRAIQAFVFGLLCDLPVPAVFLLKGLKGREA